MTWGSIFLWKTYLKRRHLIITIMETLASQVEGAIKKFKVSTRLCLCGLSIMEQLWSCQKPPTAYFKQFSGKKIKSLVFPDLHWPYVRLQIQLIWYFCWKPAMEGSLWIFGGSLVITYQHPKSRGEVSLMEQDTIENVS